MNPKKSVAILILILAAVFHASAYSQITSREIDLLAQDSLNKFGVVGAAVAVVKDGKVVHAQGYGVKAIQEKSKVNKNTQFAIASNSKAFTTAALAILVDEGKLTWQDRVKDHIPEFKMYNSYVTENFNIEDLLTHRSGLGLGVGDLMFFPDGSDFSIKDVLVNFQYFKPKSAFRTKFDYDNLLYFVAGEIIKRVSGKSWEEFVEERIFLPLSMKDSFSGFKRIPKGGNVATPHSDESGRLVALPHFVMNADNINGAAGGIYSSVDDLCHWMLLHLNRGKYGKALDRQLFSSTRQREMWSIHTPLPANRNPRYKSHFRGYGLGWGLDDVLGNMSVFHTGGLPGMLSKTILIPDLELGVVVLTNTSNGGGGFFEAVTRTIVDSYLGLEDFGWSEKILARVRARRKRGDAFTMKVWKTVEAAKEKKIDSKSYIGVYRDPWFGKMEVFTKDHALWIRSYRSPKLNGPLRFYKANAFAVKWEYQDMIADAFAIFSLDEEGVAQQIKMKGISPNIDFSFDFQDLDLQRVQ